MLISLRIFAGFYFIDMQTYHHLRDNCRKQLLPYLERALNTIPQLDKPRILDAGCGTGVPTLFLAQRFKGTITAIDPDNESIATLNQKVIDHGLSDRVFPQVGMIDSTTLEQGLFDIIIAEGLLNIIGFEKGMGLFSNLVKPEGYLIIHDADADHEKKVSLLAKLGYSVITFFSLGQEVWWEDYYAHLEQAIQKKSSPATSEKRLSDQKEITAFKDDPSPFCSRYYCLHRIKQ